MSKFAETIYKNKYAAQVNGRKEEWPETAARVAGCVMGPYLPGLVDRVRLLIEQRKFMPGGRYLYAAGKRFPQCNNCLAGETRFVTREGTFTLLEKVGQSVQVLNRFGQWEWAEVRSFGIQHLLEVTFEDGSVVFATPNHRWWQEGNERVETTRLKQALLQPETTCMALPDGTMGPVTEEHWQGKLPGFAYQATSEQLPNNWLKVRSIEDPGRYEEVFCCVVPGSESFTLSGSLITSNCFLLKAEDSREGWGQLFDKSANCLMTGGGIGVVYTPIRPWGMETRGMGGIATGPCSTMGIVNEQGRRIMQGGSRRCLPVGTLVWTERGRVPIEEVGLGDQVKTMVGCHQVVGKFDQGVQRTVRVHSRFGELECTGNHRVAICSPERSPGGWYRWKEAGQLVAGDCLVHNVGHWDFRPSFVEGIEDGREVHTFDLEVEGRNEFVAGIKDQEFLVHNSAIWAGVHWWHPDVMKFIAQKQWSPIVRQGKREDFNFPGEMDMTNISVILDDAFFEAYSDPTWRRTYREWGSSFEVTHAIAQAVYWACVRGMLKDGEPGFSIDIGENEGENLRNAPLTSSTNVYLRARSDRRGSGYELIGHIIDESVEVWTGKQWARTTFHRTGVKVPTLVVSLSNGRAIGCDPEHPFVVVSGRRVPAAELKVGMLLMVSLPPGITLARGQQREHDEVRVVAVSQGMDQDVYCCDVGVPEHSFQAEGAIVSNCTEVTSRDTDDMCNLASLNLARIESLEELAEIVEVGTAFLLCGTLYSKLPLEHMYRVREKNRRLGLGLMGVHEWLLRRGKSYGPDAELEDWLKVYAMSGAFANRYADKLSISRPVATRASAPCGTISIVAETTSGIEPIFATAYKRRYLDGQTWKVQHVVDATAKRIIEDTKIDPDLVEDALTLAEDVERRIHLQSWVQSFIDHGISSTLNLPKWGSSINNESTVDSFGKSLLKHLPNLRGITAYPDGSRDGQPLVRTTYREAIQHVGVEFVEGAAESCKDGVCGA